jgi:hypothetical protein
MKFTEIDIPQDIKVSDYYNKRNTLSYSNTGKPIRFQIPKMYMPFGISGFTPEIGPTKWNIDFSMAGWNQDDSYTKKFYEFLKNLEEFIFSEIKKNSIEIFGVAQSDINLKNIFNSNIKENPSGPHDPKFRVKVDTDSDGFIKPSIFDMNETNITSEASKGLYKGYTGVSTIELSSIYYMNKKFGLTWKLCQMKVFETQRLHGFQFNLPDETDDAEEEAVKVSGFQFQI